MRNDLDRDLECSLEEPRPAHSRLDAAHLHRHDGRILRQEAAFSARDEQAQAVFTRIYRVLAVVAAAGIILLLLWSVTDLPAFGGERNPADNEVARRYLEDGVREGGALNLVANIILDYRAFDTLGESNVLFTAACAVLLLLRRQRRADLPHAPEAIEADPPADPVLRAGAALLSPAILMLGLYLILTGHLGPGGGFSGGAVLSGALILYRCAFGGGRVGQLLTYRVWRGATFAALAFYAVSKAYSFFTGANGLPSVFSPGTPGSLFSAGLIPPLNIAVGLVVCCIMYGFFALFRKGEM